MVAFRNFALFSLAFPGNAQVEFMCQCDFQDNIWVHDFSSMLLYIQDLPKTLSNLEDPSTKWILQQKCEEDASTYPNSVQPFDIHEVLQLQENDATTVHNSCLPGHLAMSMVCAQQWIAKKSLMGVVKWVSKMNELMTVVNVCMDQHSPVPFHLDDFTRYMERFAGGVPPPQHPAFVQSLAWPTKAVAKQASETAKAMLECLPLKDPSCFPRSSTNVFESCSQCCDLSHGPQGQERCWQDGLVVGTFCGGRVVDQEKNALKKSLDVEMKKVVELESVLKVQKENLKSCEDEKEGKVKELQSQEEVLKSLQEASDKKNTASDESGNALAALKAEKEKLESAASEVQKTLKKSLAEVEGQLKASEAKVKELTENSATEKAAGETKIKEELDKLRGEMQKKEAEMQKKDAEVKKKDTEVQMKNAELEKQKAGMKKKEEEFEKKEAAMAKLETSMVAREKEAAAIAKKKEAELQKRLDEAQKQKEAEVQQLQEQLKEAQGKQGKPEVELQKTKEELKKSQQKSQQDTQELQKLRSEVENLKAAKGKEKNAELETMKANMAKATEQSKKDSIELTKLKDELQSQKTELEASQKKLNESQQKRNQLDAELRKVMEESKTKQVQKELCQAMASTPKDLQQELKDLLGVGPI
eukprot:symbB.v1.2.024587.t1/scaffold2337.1/size81945/3